MTIISISRILHGDFIWFFLGGWFSVVLATPALLIKRKWVATVLYIALAMCGILLAHSAYEAFNTWYTTPLGPSLTIVK